MAKMHELLAAEANVNAVYNAMVEETFKVLDKGDAFTKTVTKKEFFNEADSHLNTIETKDKTTTVDERLGYFFGRAFAGAIDLGLQKDSTNQVAKADVVVDGNKILTGIPATALLSWESRFEALRRMLLKVPTLPHGPIWEEDEQECLWKTSEPVVSFTTKKTMKPVILHEATKEHPAQVKEVFEDVPVARIEKTTWSGMWTSKQKADALARLDALLIAIKKARQRANRTEVVKAKAGKVLADFILKGPQADDLSGDDSED
jgi:hypothetical protein